MAKKKIAVITYNVNDGLVHQRIHLPFRHLKDEYDFVFRSLGDIHHSDLHYVDAAVLVHPHSSDLLYLASRFRKHYNIPVIVDLDDLLQNINTDHPEYVYFQHNKVEQILMQADFAVFSTNYLHRKLGHLLKKEHSCVIENTISVKAYSQIQPINKIYKNTFIVGWTGGQTHRGDQYYTFLDGLSQFLRDYPDAKAYFHLLCPDKLLREFGSQIIFEPNPCDFLDYPAFSATYPFDVCLVGLTPSEFNEAKSDLKLLEMAPHKIPIIASPRSDFIQHKERDIMMYAEDGWEGVGRSWYEKLRWCYNNREKLPEIGQRAYDYVMNERRSEVAAYKWSEVIKGVLEWHQSK